MPRVNSEGGKAWCEDCNWAKDYRAAQYAAVAAGKHRTGRCDEAWPTCPNCGYIPRAAKRSGAEQSLRRHLGARACWHPRSQLPGRETRCPTCGWVSGARRGPDRRASVRRHVRTSSCWRHRRRAVRHDAYQVAISKAGYATITDAEWKAHFDAFPEVYVMLWVQVFRGWSLQQVYPQMMLERPALKAARVS